MTHRLGFKGYMIAWAAGAFYVLMFITSPTEVAPATLAFIKGIVGAADAAGEGVGQVHDDLERQHLEDQIREEVRVEVEQELLTDPTTTPDIGSEEQGSRYLGPADALTPARVWATLHNAETAVAERLDRRGLRAGGSS